SRPRSPSLPPYLPATATATLSLHDALPISATSDPDVPRDRPPGPHGCSRSTERSPAPGRSARLRGSRDAPRRTRSWLEAAVELRLGKIRRCLAQDLVGLPQLAYLALERLHPRPLVRRQARAQPLVTLGPTHPVAQRLGRAPDLPGNRLDRRPLRTVRALVLQHHPHRPLPDFRGILHWLGHDSILSRVGASRNPGAVQRGSSTTLRAGGNSADHGTLSRTRASASSNGKAYRALGTGIHLHNRCSQAASSPGPPITWLGSFISDMGPRQKTSQGQSNRSRQRRLEFVSSFLCGLYGLPRGKN